MAHVHRHKLPALFWHHHSSEIEQGEREYISCMIEMGKGKCACGKLIDQADSLISFVIVIAYVCVYVCGQNREEIGEKKRESPVRRASCFQYYKFEGY